MLTIFVVALLTVLVVPRFGIRPEMLREDVAAIDQYCELLPTAWREWRPATSRGALRSVLPAADRTRLWRAGPCGRALLAMAPGAADTRQRLGHRTPARRGRGAGGKAGRRRRLHQPGARDRVGGVGRGTPERAVPMAAALGDRRPGRHGMGPALLLTLSIADHRGARGGDDSACRSRSCSSRARRARSSLLASA